MAVSVPTSVGSFASSAALTSTGAQALTASVPANALLMVTVAGGAASVTYGVSDSQGHTWSSLPMWTQPSGTLMSTQVFYTKIVTPLTTSDTITATRSNSNSLTFLADYVTGQHLTTPIGNGGTTPNNSSSTTVTTLDVGTTVSANAGDMTRAALVLNGNATNPTSSVLTVNGNIVSTVATTRRSAVGYRIAAVNETPQPGFSWTTAVACAVGGYVIAAAPVVTDPWTYSKIARLG